MNYRHILIGVSLSLAVHLASAGPNSTSFGKNYGKTPPPPPEVDIPPLVVPPSPSPRNRVGILATGGLGISAEFLTNAFTKKYPKVPISHTTNAYTKKYPKVPISHTSQSEDDADFSPGFEVFYEHVFSDTSETSLWGLRASLGYTQIEADNKLNGSGKYGNISSLQHGLDADLVHVSVGPFYEHRFTDQFYAQVSAGITGAYMNADLKTRDSASYLSEDGSESEFLFGTYASLALGYDFTPNWGVTGGIRYQYLDTFEIDNGATKAELDFDSAYFIFLGLRWAF